LQKKNATGLTGIMTEFKGDTVLHTLDSITNNIFCGISVVKCNTTEYGDVDILKQKLHDYMDIKDSQIGAVLEQVLPNKESFDFWWMNQSCEFKGGMQIQECIFQDNKTDGVNFY